MDHTMNIDNMHSNDEWQAILAGFQLAYGYLSKAFYEPPQAAFLDHLFQEDLFAEWPLDPDENPDEIETQRGLELLRDYGRGWGADQLPALRADYDRLFAGPERLLAYPWSSVYLSEEHLLFDTPTLEVRAFYHRFGLGVPQEGREPDDHIGLELALMVHLCGLGLEAIDAGDAATRRRALLAQREFLERHLLRWAPTFAGAVIRSAATDYYRGVGHLARGTLNKAAALFELSVAAVELE